MMKRLLLASMLLAISVVYQCAKAEIIMPCNGAFYTDNIRISNKDLKGDYFKVPFKAWFDFPCSYCHLHITMPCELELRCFEPGEDFDSKWNLYFCEIEDLVVNENGEDCHVYNLVIYSTEEQGVLWEPRSVLQPYKMFSLGFYWKEFNENKPSCKIGNIEITSYMINYSNVTQWCPFYDNDGKPTRGDCGDLNEDGEINVSDVNMMTDILLRKDYSKLLLTGDVNLDGSVDIIDLRMTVEAMYGYRLNGYWYTGHTIEEGHSTATLRWVYIQDLNGDDSVDVGDVTVLIDSVLHGNTSELYDVNGDGSADVADVIELIDAVLNGY